jgi:hypothetical protein
LISSDASRADDYIKEGAMAFVAKLDMGTELRSAVASAHSGQKYVSRSADIDAQADALAADRISGSPSLRVVHP